MDCKVVTSSQRKNTFLPVPSFIHQCFPNNIVVLQNTLEDDGESHEEFIILENLCDLVDCLEEEMDDVQDMTGLLSFNYNKDTRHLYLQYIFGEDQKASLGNIIWYTRSISQADAQKLETKLREKEYLAS